MTTTDFDIDLSQMIDYEANTACEYASHDQYGPSDLPGEWIVIHSGCCPAVPTMRLFCVECKNHRINPHQRFVCSSCRDVSYGVERIVSVIPV